MAIRIYKVADVIDHKIVFSLPYKKGHALGLLDILFKCESTDNPHPDFHWQVAELVHPDFLKMEEHFKRNGGTPPILLELKPIISASDSPSSPFPIGDGRVVFSQNQFFGAEREPRSDLEREEIVLRVKKYIYDQDVSLTKLRSAVANIEAAIEYNKTGPKREKINDDVKLIVWARDGGACVRCGAKQNLHFDHIIPLAMGGGNTEKNLQILCEVCNLKKAANLASK